MKKIATQRFWLYLAERALKTFLQVLVAAFLAALVGIVAYSWIYWIAIAVIAAMLSVIMSAFIYVTKSKADEFVANGPLDDGEH